MVNDYLEHQGVKGMRWGHRKDRSYSKDSQEVRDIRSTKKMKAMSNDELQKVNKRMQLEATNRQLRTQNVNQGRKLVDKFGTMATTAVMSAVIGYGINSTMKAVKNRNR